MWRYRAPLRDIEFTLEEWLAVRSDWAEAVAFADLDVPTARQILEAAAEFSSEVVAPINASGDLEGCHYLDGNVTTPQGYREAYQAYVRGGWPALACQPDIGGQGLPQVLNAALLEMLTAANHAWTMYPGLAHGACECIRAHGSTWLKSQYLPKLVSGEWLATMCLTEAHAGSDLGLLRTRAQLDPSPADERRYRVSGTKIFISGGEQDLTDNIIHLVLARLPDSPRGAKGLSLFIVPKRLEVDGAFAANAVRCDGIEKKMGIKGSATCVMTFDNAIGWLVGEPHRGLAAMFVMMNSARLHVALQGLGHAEAAYQISLGYARERVQSRAPASTSHTRDAASVPIIRHPAIRRTLLRLRAWVQGERCIGYWIAHLLDLAEHHPDPSRRAHSAQLASLLTPVAKAFFTKNGFQSASDALQVLGGHGYVHDNAIEQTLRDSRIAMIYEGTNEIQAIDLLLRKVIGDDGVGLRLLLQIMQAEAGACLATAECRDFGLRLSESVAALVAATDAIRADTADEPELPFRVADDYLHLLGLILLAHAWARAARVSQPRVQSDNFYCEKWATAQFYFQFMLADVQHQIALLAAARRKLPDS
jgi:alkylation response protein AidB-like acyl-CoA dehydrogenase